MPPGLIESSSSLMSLLKRDLALISSSFETLFMRTVPSGHPFSQDLTVEEGLWLDALKFLNRAELGDIYLENCLIRKIKERKRK